MGFLDKAKELAKSGVEKAKEGAELAKKTYETQKAAYDERMAVKEAEAIARENEGLTPEEIVAKDEAKNIICFPKVHYGKAVDTGAAVAEAIQDQMIYGGAFVSSNVLSNTNTGLTVNTLNPGNRRIKYLHFTFSALNRVGDVFQTQTFTQEGPIEPNEKTKYFYKGCFNRPPARLVLEKVHIEYFEGNDVVIESHWMKILVQKCTCE